MFKINCLIKVCGLGLWCLTPNNVVSSTLRQERGSNSQQLVVISTDCTGSCNPTAIRPRPPLPFSHYKKANQIQQT